MEVSSLSLSSFRPYRHHKHPCCYSAMESWTNLKQSRGVNKSVEEMRAEPRWEQKTRGRNKIHKYGDCWGFWAALLCVCSVILVFLFILKKTQNTCSLLIPRLTGLHSKSAWPKHNLYLIKFSLNRFPQTIAPFQVHCGDHRHTEAWIVLTKVALMGHR